jgi:hypothetical protein
MAQKPRVNVADSMLDDGEKGCVPEEATRYRLKLSDFSRGLLVCQALPL